MLSVAHSPRIGLVSSIAIYMLMLVFVGRLAEFHAVFAFRGLGFLTTLFACFALITAKRKQSLTVVYRVAPVFKYVLVFMAMVYFSVPFSVYKGGAFNSAKSYLYVAGFFFLLLSLAKGEHGLSSLLNSGLLVFGMLTLGLVKNYGTGRVTVGDVTYDPNDVAYVLISLLPLMFYYLQTKRKVIVKSLGYLVVLASVAGIALTQSRGGAIAFVLVFLMYLRFEKISPKLILAGILIAVIALFFLPQEFWERMSTLTDITTDYNYQSEFGRLAIWEKGIDLFLSHIFTGVGAGQFSAASGMAGAKYMTAHNAYIQIATELGLVGIVCYVMMTLGPLRPLKRRIKNPAMQARPHYLLYKGLYIAFVAQFFGSLFLSVGYFHSFYYLLAVFIVLTVIDAIYDHEETQEQVEPVAEAEPEAVRKRYPEKKRRRSYTLRKDKTTRRDP